MPIYEYACAACGAKLEIFQGINDSPLIDCQQCSKPALQKLISATGFHLKGDGWYATGYETGSKKNNDKKDKKKKLADSNTPSTCTAPVPVNSDSKTEASV